MFDTQEVFKRKKREVAYKPETIKTAEKAMGKIKTEVEKIYGVIKENERLNKGIKFSELERDNLYILGSKLVSATNYFIKHWSNLDKNLARKLAEGSDLYDKIMTVSAIYNQSRPDTTLNKFASLIKPDDDLILNPLNKFLRETTSFLKSKSLDEKGVTESFTKARVFTENLKKDLLYFSEKGYDLNYLDHQRMAKYNIHFEELFKKINRHSNVYHSLIRAIIPDILVRLKKISLQSNAVIDLSSTLNEYILISAELMKIPQKLESKTNNVIPIAIKSKTNSQKVLNLW